MSIVVSLQAEMEMRKGGEVELRKDGEITMKSDGMTNGADALKTPEHHEAELKEMIQEIREKHLPAADIGSALKLNEDALVWMEKLVLNDAIYQSQVGKRIRESDSLRPDLGPKTFRILRGEEVIVEAEWTFLGAYAHSQVDEETALASGVAPGNYWSWAWAWALIEENEPELQELKQQVEKIEDLQDLRGNVSLTQDAFTIRYILGVVTEKLNFEHIYTQSTGNAKHVWGFRNIRYPAPEIPERVEAMKKLAEARRAEIHAQVQRVEGEVQGHVEGQEVLGQGQKVLGQVAQSSSS